ncbi:MAG: hypothetical protein K0M49_13170 [Arenimonas sp.]|nr:hypothetical protein [Rhizobium sp.]MBW8446574.1 hypothetical protein [Arenimonas sp.]
MTDKALDNAEFIRKQLVKRRIQLNSEIIALDEQIGKIDLFIQDWHAFAGDSLKLSTGEENDSSIGTTESQESRSRRTTGNSRKEEVAATAYLVIQERGTPLSRDELLNAVTERGMVIEGKDRAGVFTTMMWRMRDKIVKLESGGYWLADVEYPPEGYVPQKTGSEDPFADWL